MGSCRSQPPENIQTHASLENSDRRNSGQHHRAPRLLLMPGSAGKGYAGLSKVYDAYLQELGSSLETADTIRLMCNDSAKKLLIEPAEILAAS